VETVIPRYTRPEMGAIWEDRNRYQRWLDVELAVCDVLAERGEIPREAAAAIRAKAAFDPERIDAIEREVRHDVIAFLTNVAEHVGPESRYIHLGLTSSDVLDTALALQIREAGGLLSEQLERLLAVLRRQAEAHRRTVMIGRTHGIHAEPTTLGLKFALWHLELGRDLERLRRGIEVCSVGKISGPVGTLAHLDPEVEEESLRRLGLRVEPVATQVVQRDRHAEFVFALGLTATTLDKIATEIRHHQRTEVRELEEPFGRGQKGSSSMPHKRNPIGCEQVSGLARLLRGHVQAALENVPLWHERDISHSSVERVILPDGTILLHHMLWTMTRILDGLRIDAEAMRLNLERTRGLVYSGTVLVELARAGLSREDAYRLVQRHAMRAWESGEDFAALLGGDPEIGEHLSAETLAACFDLDHHLRHVDRIFARAFGDAVEGAAAGGR
jgi:adenylosuccinate lyase